MNDEILKEQVLADNDLRDTINKFIKSDDTVWHINRHPIDVDRSYPGVDVSDVRLGITLGLALLRKWLRLIQSINSHFPLISKPYLVIEVDWLNRVEHSSPPYVYICLAKDEDSFVPVKHNEAVDREIDIEFGVDMTGLTTKFLKGFDGDGAWLIFDKD